MERTFLLAAVGALLIVNVAAQDRLPPIPGDKQTAAQKKAWKEFASEMSWLNSSHRVLLRLACIWVARMDDPDADFGVSATQALSSILSKLGATPVDESKVAHDDGGEDDPDEKFFKRG